MSRNAFAAIVASIVVVAVLVLGFRDLGGPKTQRKIQSDLRAVRTLGELAQQINAKWASGEKALPGDLGKFPSLVKQDPVSGKSFGYRTKSSHEYELCATFATDNRNAPGMNTADPWIHPAGDYCFSFDASQPVPTVPYYY